MGNQDEQFCLKWNDFQQCIKSTFQDLRDDDDFMDVTLSCDGEQIRAHKVILSACSITFKNLLKKNPSQNPVILLWDMSPRDLSAILDFMYNGEVNVKQEHLNSFLSVAEKLRVRGLCQSDTKPTKDKEPPKIKSRTSSSITAPSPKEQHVSEPPPVKRAKYEAENDDIQEIPATPQVKTEAGFSAVVETPQPVQLAGEAFTEEYTEGEGDYGEYYDEEGSYGVDPVDQSQAGKEEAVDPSGEERVILSNGSLAYACQYCGKIYPPNRKSNWKRHVLTVHTHDEQLPCSVCRKVFKNKVSLSVHVSNAHGGVRKESDIILDHIQIT